jgi:hypothetical protein
MLEHWEPGAVNKEIVCVNELVVWASSQPQRRTCFHETVTEVAWYAQPLAPL